MSVAMTTEIFLTFIKNLTAQELTARHNLRRICARQVTYSIHPVEGAYLNGGMIFERPVKAFKFLANESLYGLKPSYVAMV